MSNATQRILRILLVDDDADTRQMVSMMIQKAGHEVHTTASGIDALALLTRKKMDVILLDILMPELDGLSLLETIRTTSQAPVLMLTAVSHAEIMQQAYVMGADDYVVKPFMREKLLDRIYRLANRVVGETPIPAPTWTSRYWLDSANNILVHNGTAINLSTVESQLLQIMMESPYQELSDVALHETGWGSGSVTAAVMEERVLGTVKGLQVKLEEDPSEPKILLITPEGYIFNPETS
ncbi:MAG TPA: response regulator transcription factor [Bellilinea sp.]